MSDYGNEPERYPWEHWHPAGHARRRIAGFGDVCVADDQEWPCDTVRAAVPSPVPAGTEREGCVFCQKARDERWSRTVVRFEPLNPVTPGHMLFVPREHVSDAAENHVLTGLTFEAAARYAEGRGEAFNLITSAGRAATQTVDHLHVHYVPRRFDDGLALPWSAAVVSSSPATPEGGRVALQERVAAALALCHRADYGGDDWPYPDHYVPASRIRDALTDIDPAPSPAFPAETADAKTKVFGPRSEGHAVWAVVPASPAETREGPEVVTICGSTKFKTEILAEVARLTLDGLLVISLGVFGHTDLPDYDWTTDGSDLKRMLDELHKRKIDLADRVHVVNPGGYYGDSTRGEIEYARSVGKPVTFMESASPAVSLPGEQPGGEERAALSALDELAAGFHRQAHDVDPRYAPRQKARLAGVAEGVAQAAAFLRAALPGERADEEGQ